MDYNRPIGWTTCPYCGDRINRFDNVNNERYKDAYWHKVCITHQKHMEEINRRFDEVIEELRELKILANRDR